MGAEGQDSRRHVDRVPLTLARLSAGGGWFGELRRSPPALHYPDPADVIDAINVAGAFDRRMLAGLAARGVWL